MGHEIYVVGATDGPQKIGVTSDLKRRLALLQTGNGHVLSVAVRLPIPDNVDAQEVERFAHYLLRERQACGEWFNVVPEQAINAVKAALDAVGAGARAPLGYGKIYVVNPVEGVDAKAAALRDARASLRMSQKKLAGVLGIPPPYLSQIEHGNRPIPMALFPKLPPEIRGAVIDAWISELNAMR